MTHIEAVIVVALLRQDNAPSDRLNAFMIQFPEHRDLVRECYEGDDADPS